MSFDYIVVDVEFFVWITGREVEYEVIMEGVGVVAIVEFGEFCFFNTELEGSRLDNEPKNKDYETNENDDCYKEFPNYAEKAATTSSATVIGLCFCHKTACGCVKDFFCCFCLKCIILIEEFGRN